MLSSVFFSINSLLNVNYEGAEGGSSFLIYSVFVFFMVCFYTLQDFKLIKKRFCFIIPFFFTFVFFVEYSTSANNTQSELMQQSFIYFWAFTVPCILVGTNIGNTKDYNKVFMWIDVLALITSLGCVVALPRLLLSSVVSLGGGDYQLLSYVSAFSFSIFLYNILNDNISRFPLLRRRGYTLFTIFLMLGCVLCIFGSGGRGGFLLLSVDMVILFYSRRKWIVNHLWGILLIIPLLLVFISFIDKTAIEMIWDNGAERIINTFFTGEGGVSKTGREDVYASAFQLISDNPFGYGFFRAYAIAGNYPHNIFLEIILNGGFLLLLVSLVLLFRMTKKLKLMIRLDKRIAFIPILVSYPFVMLLFTTSYLWTGLFWVNIAFVASYKIDSHPNMNVSPTNRNYLQ